MEDFRRAYPRLMAGEAAAGRFEQETPIVP
jgi:hypothetical protein